MSWVPPCDMDELPSESSALWHGDTCGRRYLPEDVIVVLVSMSGLRVKTLSILDSAAAMLCAILPPEGVVTEPRCARAWLDVDLPLFFFGSIVSV